MPSEIREFFAEARRRTGAASPAAEASEPLVGRRLGSRPTLPKTEDDDPKVLSSLPIVERMKLAMKGSREQRAQLVRDSNRMVATAVLSSPKLTDSEVETFAKMGERVRGRAADHRDEPRLAEELRRDPRPGRRIRRRRRRISMQLLQRLNEKDIKMLAVDRNVTGSAAARGAEADGQGTASRDRL